MKPKLRNIASMTSVHRVADRARRLRRHERTDAAPQQQTQCADRWADTITGPQASTPVDLRISARFAKGASREQLRSHSPFQVVVPQPGLTQRLAVFRINSPDLARPSNPVRAQHVVQGQFSEDPRDLLAAHHGEHNAVPEEVERGIERLVRMQERHDSSAGRMCGGDRTHGIFHSEHA